MHLAIKVFCFRHLTIPSVFYLAFLLMIYLPGVLLYFVQTQTPEPSSFLASLQVLMAELPGQREPTRATEAFFYGLQLALVFIPLGVIVTSMIFHFRPLEIKQYWARPILPESESVRQFTCGALLFLGLAVVIYNLSQIRQIPLLYALANPGDTLNIVLYREELKLLHLPFFASYLFGWTGDLFLPLVCMLTLERFVARRSGKWLFLFLFSLSLTMFYNFMTGERKPLVQFLVVLLFFFILLGILRFNWRTVLIGVVTIFLLPGLSYIWLLGYGLNWRGILSGSYRIYERVFQIPTTAVAWYFQFFPVGAGGFLYGRSNRWIALLAGQKFFNTASYVGSRMFSGGPLGTGLSNAAFMGNAYADFGLPGVAIMAFLVGILLQTVQIFVLRRAKTALNVSIYAFLAVSSISLISSDIFSFLLTFGLIVAFVMLVVARPLLRQLATKKPRA